MKHNRDIEKKSTHLQPISSGKKKTKNKNTLE